MNQNEIVIKDSLRLKINNEASYMQISLKGFIDAYNSYSFQNEINQIIKAGSICLLFDCNDLSYVSSTGIGAFASFLNQVRQKSGNIVLTSLQPRVYEVFKLLGFTKSLNIVQTTNEGAAFFNKSGQPEIPSIFPINSKCPSCQRSMQVTRPGKFRCSSCKTIIAVDIHGTVQQG